MIDTHSYIKNYIAAKTPEEQAEATAPMLNKIIEDREDEMSRLEEITKAIEAANQVFMDTYSQGDAARMSALYAEGGQYFTPYGDTVTGKEAIEAAFHGQMEMGVKVVKLETVEVEDFGVTASETGKFTVEGECGRVLGQGTYLVIWKQEGGQWKMLLKMSKKNPQS